MSMHTKAPWTYLRLDASNYSIISLEEPHENGDPRWTTICRLNTALPEVEANAHLLAAAPKMLAALQGLVACIDSTRGKDANEALQAANAVIREANGAKP
jgi:hypothetical protein